MRLEYFELVDRILELSVADGHVRAAAAVPTKSTIFEGHFPDHPIMPGVLLIEAMAQTSGWIILARMQFERMPFIVGVEKARLRNFVKPGTNLELDARLEHEGSGYTRTKTRVFADGKEICDAELTFRILPFPTPIFHDMVLAAARRVGFPMEALAHAP